MSETLVEGVIVSVEKNKSVLIDKRKLREFILQLVSDTTWRIGFDQASTYFGLCIEDTEKKYHIQLDFERGMFDAKTEFADEIFYFLKRTFDGHKVEMLVLEQPIPSYEYAKRVLIELKGYLMAWIHHIPEFEFAEVGEIFPQSWKSLVIPKELGGGQCADKAAMANVVCERIPALSEYKSLLRHKDYDSFDAANILEGYLKYSRDEYGNKMICGIIEKKHVSFVACRTLSLDSFSGEQVLSPFQSDDIVENLAVSRFKPEYLVFNPRFGLHENIRMASSHHEAVVTTVPKKHWKNLMFTYDFIDIENDNQLVLLYIYALKAFTQSELGILKSILPAHERVYQ